MNKNFYLLSLQYLIDNYSNNQIKKKLKSFKCSINKDIEEFLHNKAITFEKKLRDRTYILLDKETQIAGYFSIAISVLYAKDIQNDILLEIGDLNTPKDIPCLLIGQIAKSDKFKDFKIGGYLMDLAIEQLEVVNKILGGRFILLDAINNDKVIKFYESFGFIAIDKESLKENVKMIRPFYS